MSKESSFGLPEGEKETPQLRNRYKNYVKHLKKTGGYGTGKYEDHLLRQNNFYEFNKPQFDGKRKAIKKTLDNHKK